MIDNKRNSDGKNRAFPAKSALRPIISRAQADHLQKELDHLALLLDEVKRQTEKVEAAADAIGDALISQLYAATEEKSLRKDGSQTGAKTGSRRLLRSLPQPIRAQGFERAQG
jgi:hypothetical protein